jgi:hypothetical protein
MRGKPLGQLSFHRNAILDRFSTGQRDDLEYCLVDPQQILSRRCFLGEPADAVDDVAGAVTVSQDATERLPHLVQIRRPGVEPAQSGLGVGHGCCYGLVHLMRDRSRQLPIVATRFACASCISISR